MRDDLSPTPTLFDIEKLGVYFILTRTVLALAYLVMKSA